MCAHIKACPWIHHSVDTGSLIWKALLPTAILRCFVSSTLQCGCDVLRAHATFFPLEIRPKVDFLILEIHKYLTASYGFITLEIRGNKFFFLFFAPQISLAFVSFCFFYHQLATIIFLSGADSVQAQALPILISEICFSNGKSSFIFQIV